MRDHGEDGDVRDRVRLDTRDGAIECTSQSSLEPSALADNKEVPFASITLRQLIIDELLRCKPYRRSSHCTRLVRQLASRRARHAYIAVLALFEYLGKERGRGEHIPCFGAPGALVRISPSDLSHCSQK